MRTLTYEQAINEALKQEMERDKSVFVYGIGVPDHKRIFGTTNGILENFGALRCLDTPLSEDAMTGFGIGAAINGLRPVHIHIRVDFLLLAVNQLVNMASAYRYMSHGELKVPIVIRAIIGRGWGQGCQHSKSMFSTFAHVPGLKVIMPTTPYDAKGMLTAAIRDDNPVIVFEHRWLYWQTGEVPEESYAVPLEGGSVIRQGDAITIGALSWMNAEAHHAAQILSRNGVEVEIVDIRALAPLDDECLIRSVKKTGRCIIVDSDWVDFGASAELAYRVSLRCFGKLKEPVARIGFAPIPCPTARHMENLFYPNAATIIRKVEEMLGIPEIDLTGEDLFSHERRFKGPF